MEQDHTEYEIARLVINRQQGTVLCKTYQPIGKKIPMPEGFLPVLLNTLYVRIALHIRIMYTREYVHTRNMK